MRSPTPRCRPEAIGDALLPETTDTCDQEEEGPRGSAIWPFAAFPMRGSLRLTMSVSTRVR